MSLNFKEVEMDIKLVRFTLDESLRPMHLDALGKKVEYHADGRYTVIEEGKTIFVPMIKPSERRDTMKHIVTVSIEDWCLLLIERSKIIETWIKENKLSIMDRNVPLDKKEAEEYLKANKETIKKGK